MDRIVWWLPAERHQVRSPDVHGPTCAPSEELPRCSIHYKQLWTQTAAGLATRYILIKHAIIHWRCKQCSPEVVCECVHGCFIACAVGWSVCSKAVCVCVCVCMCGSCGLIFRRRWQCLDWRMCLWLLKRHGTQAEAVWGAQRQGQPSCATANSYFIEFILLF